MENIPFIIIPDYNMLMIIDPIMDKVKDIMSGLSGDNACGPDRFTGIFFQKCWDIFIEDIKRLVRIFFCGQTLPRFIMHIHLVMLPKRESVKEFTNMRPLSLCNFFNKIISTLIHIILGSVIPKLISLNQTSFKGRSITENVLLAQDIIR